MRKNVRRLDQVQAAVGPEHNALVWLEYFHRNQPLPPSFWKVPDADYVERLTDQVLQAYPILGLWVVQTDAQTSRLELMLSMLQLTGCVLNWHIDVFEPEPSSGRMTSAASKRWRDRENFLEGIASAASEEIAKGWNATWDSLRTAELVAEDLGTDFLGRDVLDEEQRTMLTRVRERLDAIKGTLMLFGVQVEPRDPTPQAVKSVLGWIRRV